MLKDVRGAGGCTLKDVRGAEEFSQVIMLACLFIWAERR